MSAELSLVEPTGDDREEESADGLPGQFQLRRDGIFVFRESGDGEELVKLCSPIRVLALARDHDEKGWSRVIEVTTPDGRKHSVVLPDRLLAGDGRELEAELRHHGLQLETWQGSRNHLLALLNGWRPARRALTVERLGWVDETYNAFVIGAGRAIGTLTEEVLYQSPGGRGWFPEDAERMIAIARCESGLRQWHADGRP